MHGLLGYAYPAGIYQSPWLLSTILRYCYRSPSTDGRNSGRIAPLAVKGSLQTPFGTLASLRLTQADDGPHRPFTPRSCSTSICRWKKQMKSITDPWVVHYERLMDILNLAGVARDIPSKTQRKILITHRDAITDNELNEALSLFKTVYGEEI